MACPYLREVVMLSCDAFHVKKMLPLDRIATGNPCLGEFNVCPFYQECTTRLVAAQSEFGSQAAFDRGARERVARERSGAEGPPRATEPGYGAEPHVKGGSQ
jgi:hypothetical protein